MKNKLLFILGTRPEAIKMAPLIKQFQKDGSFQVKVCVTAQHREMLDQVLHFFQVIPDFDLNLMKPNQTLFGLTARILTELETIFQSYVPDWIFVQGDTTTAFIGALAGYYQKISVVHIEAGLRSHHKYSPFPEELNRILAGHLADVHFAPTPQAKENLAKEGIDTHVYVVGNTVVDALFLGLKMIEGTDQSHYQKLFAHLDSAKKWILVTGHRRESFGEPFENMANALYEIGSRFVNDVEIIYPVHLNPHVQEPVHRILKGQPNIHLMEPLDYPGLLWVLSRSYMVLTDSGGIQEEAPSLGKPILVMRDVTERMEGVHAGTAKLVGTNKDRIVSETIKLLTDPVEYTQMATATNPYGDGTTSHQIVDILKKESVNGIIF